MRESKRGRIFVSLVVFSTLVVTLLGFGREIAGSESDGRKVWVKVPFCETEWMWSGRYRVVGYETTQVPYLDYREEIAPGTGVWRIEIKEVSYTAYRCKVSWVNKIVSVARTILKPVHKFVRKVKTWFERTWLGKLIKKIKVWLKPVTKWVKETVWDRVTQRVREVFMEPYTAYTHKPVPVWIPPRKIRVRFINYYEKRTPIKEKVMIEVPIEGSIEWRTTGVDGKDIPSWVLQLMFRRLPACDPIEDRLDEIYETWREFKGSLIAYRHDRLYRDEFELFLDGLPEGTNYQVARFATFSHGFGRGWRPWEDYTTEGASAAQYFRMRALAEEWGWADVDYYPQTHYNLCGELSVIGAVGGVIPDGLDLFNDLDFVTDHTVTVNKGKENEREIKLDTGAHVFKNNLGTWASHLEEFFEAYGWEAVVDTGDATVENLTEELEVGRAVVALVELSTTNGFLEPEGGTAHWVSVLQVLHTRDGEDIVRIYNPFQNREEYYRWDHFYACWTQTPYNSSVCLRVLAWR
jgi:hypothetical protein